MKKFHVISVPMFFMVVFTACNKNCNEYTKGNSLINQTDSLRRIRLGLFETLLDASYKNDPHVHYVSTNKTDYFRRKDIELHETYFRKMFDSAQNKFSTPRDIVVTKAFKIWYDGETGKIVKIEYNTDNLTYYQGKRMRDILSWLKQNILTKLRDSCYYTDACQWEWRLPNNY